MLRDLRTGLKEEWVPEDLLPWTIFEKNHGRPGEHVIFHVTYRTTTGFRVALFGELDQEFWLYAECPKFTTRAEFDELVRRFVREDLT